MQSNGLAQSAECVKKDKRKERDALQKHFKEWCSLVQNISQAISKLFPQPMVDVLCKLQPEVEPISLMCCEVSILINNKTILIQKVNKGPDNFISPKIKLSNSSFPMRGVSPYVNVYMDRRFEDFEFLELNIKELKDIWLSIQFGIEKIYDIFDEGIKKHK